MYCLVIVAMGVRSAGIKAKVMHIFVGSLGVLRGRPSGFMAEGKTITWTELVATCFVLT